MAVVLIKSLQQGASMKTLSPVIISILLLFSLIACETTPPVPAPEEEFATAKRLRTRIETLGFAQYNQTEYAAGETTYKQGETSFNKDNAVAKKSFDSAIVSYRTVIRSGVEARLKANESDIDPVIARADGIKTSVAAPEKYNAAKDTLEKARSLANEDNWEEADQLFQSAKKQYEEAFTEAEQKRVRAQEAMNTSQQTKTEIENAADAGTQPPAIQPPAVQ